ncbi:MAG: hypothetical protein R6X08_03300 [Desulfosalsimonadaceae bacterium]
MTDEYQIDSRIIGERLPDYEREVTLRQMMNYAAAVGDENPRHMEPARVRELACRFTGMVVPATSIRLQVLHRQSRASGKDVCFRVVNAREETALSDGYANIAE